MSSGLARMADPGADNGVVFFQGICAGPTVSVTDEGITPMKTQRYVPMHARTIPADGPTGALRTDPPVRAVRGFVILALVLGGLGADAAATSGYGSSDHASAHQPAGNISLGAGSYALSPRHITGRPWMY
jgi:hypothetical protein